MWDEAGNPDQQQPRRATGSWDNSRGGGGKKGGGGGEAFSGDDLHDHGVLAVEGGRELVYLGKEGEGDLLLPGGGPAPKDGRAACVIV